MNIVNRQAFKRENKVFFKFEFFQFLRNYTCQHNVLLKKNTLNFEEVKIESKNTFRLVKTLQSYHIDEYKRTIFFKDSLRRKMTQKSFCLCC